MAKPIAVIYFPKDFSLSKSGLKLDVNELMKELNQWSEFKKLQPLQGVSDYLWFCFVDYNIDTPKLQVFHPKDISDIEIEELKQLVLNNLPKL